MSGQRRRARLNDIAKIAEALRDPVETPDFTSSILERVHAEKPFADPETRRWVPVVRIGAACMSVMTVFAVTLIVFVKPDLPERLGAPESVTTELFLSAESGVTTKMAELRLGVKALSEAADPLRLMPLQVAAAVEPSDPPPAAIGEEAFPLAPIARAEPVSDPAANSPRTVVLPLPMPVAVQLPSSTSYSWPETRMGASYQAPTGSFGAANAGYAGAMGYAGGGEAMHRSAMLSRHKLNLGASLPAMTSPKPPMLNRSSPTLVKELVNLITGQPAGDEQVIR